MHEKVPTLLTDICSVKCPLLSTTSREEILHLIQNMSNYKAIILKVDSTTQRGNKHSHCHLTSMINIFKRETSYLILTDSERSFLFLKHSYWKTHPVVVAKMLLCFRGIKLFLCIKPIKGRKEILNDRTTLHCLVKSNPMKSTAEVMMVFNGESKSIFIHTVQREFKVLELNSRVVLK